MKSEVLESLVAKSGSVAKIAEDAAHAFEEEVRAETELLSAIVERVRPALKALGSRIQASYVLRWRDQAATISEEEETFHERRGLLVAGVGGAQRDSKRAQSGKYEGQGLYLGTDGQFFLVDYKGRWSVWQGSGHEWSSTLTPSSFEDVARCFDADDIVAAISAALDRQLAGKTVDRAAAAQARAEKFRALVAILK